MTRLRQLYEVYPAEPRATLPLGLRVDDAVYARVDGADLLTGEVTASDADVQMRAALGKLSHVLVSSGFDFAHLAHVAAYVSDDADLGRVAAVWDAANVEPYGRALFEPVRVPLPPGFKVVLDAIAVSPASDDARERFGVADGMLAGAVRLGPVLYVPALTAAAPDGSLPQGIEAQVVAAFGHLERLLERAGVARAQLLRIAGYMRDLKDKDVLNTAMVERFPVWAEKPVHKYVPSALPPGVEFALQAIAVDGAERSILEIEGIQHNDPISLGARAGNVFVSSRVQAKLEPTAREQADRLIDSHARRLVEHIGGSLDDVTQMVWGIGEPGFEADVRAACAGRWPSHRLPRLDFMQASFPHSPLPRLEFFALLPE